MRLKFIIALLVFNFGLKAQVKESPVQTNWGVQHSSPSSSYLYKIIKPNKEGILSIRIKKPGMLTTTEKIIFESYNPLYKLVKAKEYPLEYKNKSMEFEECFTLGGHIYLFSSFINQGEEKRFLFAQEVHPNSLVPEKKLTFIGEMPYSLSAADLGFKFEVSADSSHLMVFQPKKAKKGEPAKYILKVIDKDLNTDWELDYSLPGKLNMHEVEGSKLDNNGNAFLLLNSTIDKSLNSPNDSRYKIISIKNKGTVVDEFPIDLKNLFINGISFKFLNDGKIICAGFYSERGMKSIKGVFYLTIDPETKAVIKQSTKAFDFNFVTSQLSVSHREKVRAAGRSNREPELPKFNLDQLILRGDGGALLLAEQFEIVSYNEYDNFSNSITERYVYRYDDIVAVSVNPQGDIDWATRIPKSQETQDDGGIYSSYCYAVTGNNILIVFNDNPKNYTKEKKNGIPYEFDAYRGQPAYALIDSEGNFTTGVLEHAEANGFFIRPSLCKQIGANRLLLYKEYNSAYSFGEAYLVKK